MNYWPAGPTNLAECCDPVFQMISELAESGARTAAGDVRRRRLGHRTTTPTGGGDVAGRLRVYGVWQTGGAWLALLIWDHYEFTGDMAMLRQYYPAMKGSVEFFLDTLVAGPTRRATWSPTRRTRRSSSTTTTTTSG